MDERATRCANANCSSVFLDIQSDFPRNDFLARPSVNMPRPVNARCDQDDIRLTIRQMLTISTELSVARNKLEIRLSYVKILS